MLDKTAPHRLARWVALAILVSLYVLRVYLLSGFFIVTYGLGIYLLNLFIGLITPPVCQTRRGGFQLSVSIISRICAQTCCWISRAVLSSASHPTVVNRPTRPDRTSSFPGMLKA